MKANQEIVTLTTTEERHIRALRALSNRRLRAVLRFTASLVVLEREKEEVQQPEQRPVLRLVVDNTAG